MSASFRAAIDLAVAVLPKFVAGARVQASLWKAKPKLRKFYEYVTADLVGIHEILSGLSEHHDSVLWQLTSCGLSLAVERLLLRLERFSRTRGDLDTALPFPRLRALRRVAGTTSNDLCGMRRLSRAVMKDHRAKLLRHLDNCLATLTDVVIRQGQLPTTVSWQEECQLEDPDSNQVAEDQPFDVVNQAHALHKAIAKRWPCSCPKRHGALLRLASFYIDDTDTHPTLHMDLLFSHNNVDSWKWARIRLERHPAKVQFDLTVEIPSKHADNAMAAMLPLAPEYRDVEQPSTEIVHSTDCEADDADCQDIPVEPIGTLCRLILDCQQNTHFIYLLARRHRTDVHLRGKLKKLTRSSVLQLIPFSTILNGAGSNAFLNLRQNIKERLMLANVLARAVLHLWASPWARRQWVKERLCLALSGQEKSLSDSVLQLHLQSDLDEQAEAGAYDDVQHPCPVLLDLAVLLIELELGIPIQELARLVAPENQAAGMALHRSPSITLLERVLRSELLSKTFAPYKQAIWACYDCKSAGSSMAELQQWIKDKIFGPLDQLLLASFQISITPQGIQSTQDQSKTFRDPIHRNNPRVESNPFFADDRFISTLCQRGQFLDCECRLMPDEPSRWTGTDDWFESLQRKTLSHFEGLRVAGRPGKPIKIAILDTGIDAKLHPLTRAIMATNPQLSGSSIRIKGLRSWANNKVKGEDVESMKDEHGHGTHSAGLILKVTPFAHLYVAQVTNGAFFEPDPVAIAQAIRYAAEDWEVDVISMSFGFDDHVGDIPEAIAVANAKGVIMVAAASNGGKIKSEGDSYPAASVEVISIRSANGSGRPSDFNPDKPKDKVYSLYFNVVGEYVLSAWPEHLEPSGEKRVSGTSVSTPIVAGVVALLLDYVWARLPGSLDEAGKTVLYDCIRRTPNAIGMRQALKRMTAKKDKAQGLFFIKPWLLMSDQASTNWSQFEEQFKISRKYT